MALRSVSLCAGIGGIDLGLERLGAARSVCYVEREAFAAACLVAAMQRGELAEAPIWSDLRTFDARAWRGSVDLVVGGYPCQPFSHAGSRRGADDPRHLWPEVLRIFRESGARYLFCENVAGHLSLGFASVLESLAEIGATVEWGLFTASEVGAPHRRERLFFLADAASERGRVRLGDELARRGEAQGPGVAVADCYKRVPGCDGDRARNADESDAGGCGEEVADAAHLGHERAGSARNGRGGPTDDGSELVDSAVARLPFSEQPERRSAQEEDAARMDHRTQHASSELADADYRRRTPKLDTGSCPLTAGGRKGNAESRGRSELADARRLRLERRGEAGDVPCAQGSGEGDGAERQRHGHAAGDGGQDVADACSLGSAAGLSGPIARHEGLAGVALDCGGAGHRFPPGPGDAAGWRAYIRAGGPQPAVRRGADGLPHRVDRLRALGNAVVPQVAALAFSELWERMHGDDQ